MHVVDSQSVHPHPAKHSVHAQERDFPTIEFSMPSLCIAISQRQNPCGPQYREPLEQVLIDMLKTITAHEARGWFSYCSCSTDPK